MLETALVQIGRIIGKPPGWERLVRSLAPPDRFAGAPLTLAHTADGYAFPLDRGTLVGWTVNFFGCYEPEVRNEIRRWLRPGQVAIDVGANVGWHTLLMSTLVGPTGRVYAFEPNDSTRRRLVSAIEANGFTNIVVDPRAASDRMGRAAFQAPPAGHVWDGTGHLVDTATLETASIDCIKLDEFARAWGLDGVALMKIDVEGWEISVLRGARELLETRRPAVLFEYDPAYIGRSGSSGDDLSNYFAGLGYALFQLHPRRLPMPLDRLGDQGGNFLALAAAR